jgi:HSP20 family molecular chaperone IbpA
MNMKITTSLLAVLVTAATAGTTSDYGFNFIAVANAETQSPAATPAPEQNPTPTTNAPAQKPPASVDTQGVAKQAPPPTNDRFDDFYSNDQWDPYREIQRMQDEMDRIMEQAFDRYGMDPYYDPYYSDPYYDQQYGPRGGPGYGRGGYGPGPGFGPNYGPGPGPGPGMRHHGPGFMHPMRGGMTPAMDLQDKGDNYVVLVDVPGMDADGISVKLEDNRLSISAKQSYDKEDKDSKGNVIFHERRSGSFSRSLTLPGPVKKQGMKTDFDKGVLRITIPKA